MQSDKYSCLFNDFGSDYIIYMTQITNKIYFANLSKTIIVEIM